eukprot:scaffold23183_cov81-Skeletonema_dohrnii-CCMP3373.AAC.2
MQDPQHVYQSSELATSMCKMNSAECKQHINTTHDRQAGFKNADPFCQEQQKKIESVQTHNLAHNSASKREKINGLSFPEGKTSVGELSATN